MTYRLLKEVRPQEYEVHAEGVSQKDLANAIEGMRVEHKGHFKIEEDAKAHHPKKKAKEV